MKKIPNNKSNIYGKYSFIFEILYRKPVIDLIQIYQNYFVSYK